MRNDHPEDRVMEDPEAFLEVVTDGRNRTTRVYLALRDGRRIPVSGIRSVEMKVDTHEITSATIRCDLACELTGYPAHDGERN